MRRRQIMAARQQEVPKVPGPFLETMRELDGCCKKCGRIKHRGRCKK